jgi:hypothetical protein
LANLVSIHFAGIGISDEVYVVVDPVTSMPILLRRSKEAMISARYWLVEVARESEARYRALFEHCTGALILTDPGVLEISSLHSILQLRLRLLAGLAPDIVR